MAVSLLSMGDTALTVEFGNAIDPRLLEAVKALDAVVGALHAAGGLPGLIETVPTFRSLTLIYDPLVTGRDALSAALEPLLEGAVRGAPPAGRAWRLPVCYGGEGLDLEAVAAQAGIAPDALVALHSGAEYRVYMLGFLPGFPFMGDVPETLCLPRRTEPRLRVPAGSVAIAAGLTAIYPWESPGGWHLLGRCPVRLFDLARPSPSLLEAGDRVQFVPIRAAELARLEAAVAGGELDTGHWRADTGSSAR